MGTLSVQSYRWVIVAYSLVIQAVSFGILIYCFALFTLPWLDEFGASRRDIMLTISALQIGTALVGPFVGRYLDQVNLRSVVFLGLLALILGLYLVRAATALWQIWLVYVTLMPLATLMMGTLASQTLIAKWFETERGLALGLSAIGTSIGGVIFPWLVAGWLMDFGWRETLHLLAMAALVLVVPLTLIVLRRQPPAAKISGEALQTVSGEDRSWSTREILSTALFWLPFVAFIPISMGFSALQFNLGVFTRDLGLDDQAAAPLIMTSSVCMIIGKLFFGGLGDRLDHRFLYWVSMSLLCCAYVTLLVTDSYEGLFVGVVRMGLAGGGILPLLGVIFGSRFGVASFGRVMGLVGVVMMFGALAPLIFGWVYDIQGSYDIALISLLAVAIPAMIAMFWLPQPSVSAPD